MTQRTAHDAIQEAPIEDRPVLLTFALLAVAAQEKLSVRKNKELLALIQEKIQENANPVVTAARRIA